MLSTPSDEAMAAETLALVDCNSFFASCERVFQPRLKNRPVIVLSNNDGCVVARTDEAKALGIPMGVAFFKVRDLVKKNGVHVFSSNFALYGDFSARVMKTLSGFTPELEIYSIDEAFLSLKGFESRSLTDYARSIREAVMQNVGIPVSIGLAPTKVLAKVANQVAKKKNGGVFDLSSQKTQDEVLNYFPVEDIWGVGRQSTEKLHRLGIRTAKQLRDAEPCFIQKILTVVGRRILDELKGTPCIRLEQESRNKKQMICSRSFGKPIYELSELKEAVACYVTRVAERLRGEKSVCNALQVFIQTNRFKEDAYFNITTLHFITGTSATPRLITAAHEGLERIYRSGYAYKKAGVILLDFTLENQKQLSLFDSEQQEADEKRMKIVDQINRKMGQDTVKMAACGTERAGPRSESRSPCYTTRWGDLLCVG